MTEAGAGTGPDPASARPALEPSVLARIAHLELRARRVVEGALSGIHPSPHLGASVEFADHKVYTPGDEVRQVDWRLFAKSDKLYVKRHEHETNLRAWLLLDVSASMGYGARAVSKLDYARTLVASLAYLLLEQRDAVGLVTYKEGIERYVPPRSDRAHLQALIGVLEAASASGRAATALALDQLLERIPRRGLLLIVTDALEDPRLLGRALARVRSRRHDAALLRVLDVDEVEFPFAELTLFHSMEDERRLLVDPGAARKSYLAALDANERELLACCRDHQVDYFRFVTGDPPERALARFLAARGGRA